MSYRSHLSAIEGLDRTLAGYDLCGRSWQDWPEDLVEFIICTFKPLFCIKQEPCEPSPSSALLSQVGWFVRRKKGTFAPIDAMEEDAVDGLVAALDGSDMLIICSSATCRSLLGSSIRQWYIHHLDRLVRFGDAPMFLRDATILSDSPLSRLRPASFDRLELIVLPAPGRVSGAKPYLDEATTSTDNFGDLRTSYLRRAHHALGCEQHAIW